MDYRSVNLEIRCIDRLIKHEKISCFSSANSYLMICSGSRKIIEFQFQYWINLSLVRIKK